MTQSSPAMCAFPRRHRTANRRCCMTSNAPAAKPTSGSLLKSFSEKDVGASPRSPPVQLPGEALSMVEEAARSERRPRLGRGLAALLGATGEESTVLAQSRSVRQAPIEFLRPNPRNPRKRFDDAELEELAASIKERGIIQPVLVRAIPHVADAYEIIAGERRWRAAQRAGQHQSPTLVLEAGDHAALPTAIIRNDQRA